ncbi:3-hydroxyacyl-CoA dehydrogenase NAD-binding domain-containing protein [Marinobacter nanhaiticus D15-8W]|uniref:3-hydroxyacyl-CoA dehydrogenase n=1 Tax=Marinobacter nanhaiticus D15-8W TaxID=626887 RepID=N6W414_9GAMM|nr:3-hydroxyacyl-CoA dehydrogenase NAD-binding domain-containing protein [Marinobacter nanhaiticus]ENO14889.1 3-hydroxyacyl-CoA dehydrogenase [Marinobacter nanhaiticus D15-8W]BES69415.1 3-hydroxyacyl-CoA dehydrogenase NAD-binding domain-containing protein [Marinobacter nanhaiticus D15-8W]
MSEVVTYQREGAIGVITVNYPPVNALSHAVRSGLLDALKQGQADAEAKALLLVCEGRTFIAGADIREFGKPMQEPGLPTVVEAYENSDKPIIAAIHGTALGGGLEMALGCHYRVALESAKVGLPEVKLGLLPGAGGTQRLPRLAGAQKSLEMITTGDFISASDALQAGIVDAVEASSDAKAAGEQFALKVIDEGKPARRVRELTDRIEADKGSDVFEQFRTGLQKKARGLFSPFKCVDAVEAAFQLPFEEGMKRERELFMECMESPQRAGLVHAFFAEREVSKVPGLPKDTPVRDIKSVGIIGAGTMGGGIAMNFANVGIPVRLLEVKQEALDKGLAIIRRNYENTAKKGRITQAQVEERMALIQPTLAYEDFGDVDLVIEAVFENMGIKKEIFGTLDKVCKQGAILASNTSTLDIDEIASATNRPEDVVGMHFFSPANVMKLLENVRGTKTADDVKATVMDIAKRIKKVGVLVGNCYGFVGNRMLHQRGAEAIKLVNEGATPQQVDKVLTDLGFPMGQFAMSDLAGIDVGYRIREERRNAGENIPPSWMDKLAEQGRLGQKTQAGTYLYEEGSRKPIPDPKVDALIEEFRKEQGIEPREITDQEILERCMYVMINEGAKILEEGIADRALDVDIVWIYGYGFPAYRGGPMFWADQVGVKEIYETVKRFHDTLGGDQWKPAPLLERLAKEGKTFGSL